MNKYTPALPPLPETSVYHRDTYTAEEIKAFDADQMNDHYLLGYKSALASLEAEPVAWQIEGTDSFVSDRARQRNQAFSDLYTVPLCKCPQPAQAKVVHGVRAPEVTVFTNCRFNPQPSDAVGERDARHVGDTRFESWFSEFDTKQKGTKQQMRESYWAGYEECADPQSSRHADPLQGAANWLCEAIRDCEPAYIAGRLSIGYNRAKRLYDAAIASKGAVLPLNPLIHEQTK